MVNQELSITAAISGAIVVAVFLLAIPDYYYGVSQQPSFDLAAPVTPEKTKAAEISATQQEEQIVEVFIDRQGNVHVIHTLKESKDTKKIQVINGSLSNLLVIGNNDNPTRYGTSGKEPIIITIFPTEQEVLIEYDLDDVLLLKNGRWMWDFFFIYFQQNSFFLIMLI